MFFREIPVLFTEISTIGLKIKELIVDNAVTIRLLPIIAAII
jgi:hypothetical protein